MRVGAIEPVWRRRPDLLFRVAGLLLVGLALPGAVRCVMTWMFLVNGIIRTRGQVAPANGWWQYARPEAVLALVGVGVGVALVLGKVSRVGRIARRVAS